MFILPEKTIILPNQDITIPRGDRFSLFCYLRDEGFIALSESEQWQFLNHNLQSNPHMFCTHILGRLAELLIVNECNGNTKQNLKWFSYAELNNLNMLPRRYKAAQDYIAVGTGLKKTKECYWYHYQPSDTQRDIVWIPKSEPKNTINVRESNQYAGRAAALQIKVGFNNDYVKNSILNGQYICPIIYFDLANDYNDLRRYLLREEGANCLKHTLLRGKDFSPEIHDLLLGYHYLLVDILNGIYPLESLLFSNDNLLCEATQDEMRQVNFGQSVDNT